MTIFDLSAKESMPADKEKAEMYRRFFDEKLGSAECNSKPVPDQVLKKEFKNAGFVSVFTKNKLKASNVEKYIKSNKISENAFFLGAFGYALAKINGTDKSFFTTGHHGRLDKRLNNAIGMFVNTLPFYCCFEESMSPCELLKNAYNDYYILKKNDCISFGEIASQYGLGWISPLCTNQTF